MRAPPAASYDFDLYEELELQRDAGVDDIKKAYRRLALIHHPDRNGGEQSALFLRLKQSYDVLVDEDRRRNYDAFHSSREFVRDRCTTLFSDVLLRCASLSSPVHFSLFSDALLRWHLRCASPLAAPLASAFASLASPFASLASPLASALASFAAPLLVGPRALGPSALACGSK